MLPLLLATALVPAFAYPATPSAVFPIPAAIVSPAPAGAGGVAATLGKRERVDEPIVVGGPFSDKPEANKTAVVFPTERDWCKWRARGWAKRSERVEPVLAPPLFSSQRAACLRDGSRWAIS